MKLSKIVPIAIGILAAMAITVAVYCQAGPAVGGIALLFFLKAEADNRKFKILLELSNTQGDLLTNMSKLLMLLSK